MGNNREADDDKTKCGGPDSRGELVVKEKASSICSFFSLFKNKKKIILAQTHQV